MVKRSNGGLVERPRVGILVWYGSSQGALLWNRPAMVVLSWFVWLILDPAPFYPAIGCFVPFYPAMRILGRKFEMSEFTDLHNDSP